MSNCSRSPTSCSKELGVGDGAILQLNTLGDPDTRAAWRDALHEHFAARASGP